MASNQEVGTVIKQSTKHKKVIINQIKNKMRGIDYFISYYYSWILRYFFLFDMKKLSPNLDREDGLETVFEVPIPEEIFTHKSGTMKA